MPITDAGEFAWCSVFSPELSDGNQTIVIRLKSWLDPAELGAMGEFVGHGEVTFVVLEQDRLEMRWFAGRREVPLCGHGALAASAVLLPQLKNGELREVHNLPGKLWLSRLGDVPYVVFPRARLAEIPVQEVDVGIPLAHAFDAGRDYLLIMDSDEAALRNFDPAMAKRLDKIGCILSSRSESATASFRFFAPRVGITEDRASGSVIPALVEYWGRDRSSPYTFHQESGHDIKIRAQQTGDKIGLTGEVLEFARGKLNLGNIRHDISCGGNQLKEVV
jgi:predicted PhzF superfamily epimerase YddE/YHI9